jgi:hypothetical protein
VHAKVPDNSTDWGGCSSGGGAAVKLADQDNSWEVHAKVQGNSTDWGGFAWNAGDGIGRPNAKSNARSSWGEKDKMESDEHLKVPKESDTWSNLPQKTPGVIWLQHQWAIQMLSNQILGMAGMLCLLRTHKVLLNGKRQLILVTRTRKQMDGVPNLVTGAAKETILGDPQGDRMRGVHLHQDNGLN